jgi:hypothetical protein
MFTPYVHSEPHLALAGYDAYVPVRVPEGARRDGYLLVYLPDGTGWLVNGSHLLRLDEGRQASD